MDSVLLSREDVLCGEKSTAYLEAEIVSVLLSRDDVLCGGNSAAYLEA